MILPRSGYPLAMARRGGWTRAGSKGRFRYLDGRGNRIDDPAKIERIESLVIPPAWKDVWISPRVGAKRSFLHLCIRDTGKPRIDG